MTSSTFNSRRVVAQYEMQIFNSFSRSLRDAINESPIGVNASTVRNALLRGVSEESIIATITRSPEK